MADPHEGLDAEGFITTGAHPSNLRPPFSAVIDDAAAACAAVPDFHSLYVYGSVSTGMARMGDSDLDLLMVAETNPHPGLGRVEEALSRRHRDVVRAVSIATATPAEVFADDTDGLATRCFLKHYCVCVAGEDLSTDLPRCRPSVPLVIGLTADTRSAMDSARGVTEPRAIGPAARAVARKLLLTGAAVASLHTGTWTTDRARAAQWLTGAHPQRTGDIATALRWANPAAAPEVHPTELHELVDDFGTWVLAELDAALRQSR